VLNPDFILTPTASVTARTITFPQEIGDLVEDIPGVDSVQLVRNARIMYRDVPVMMVAVETSKLASKVRPQVIAGNIDEMYRAAAEGRGLIVSDAFQANHGAELGSIVELPTPAGVLALPVAGVIRDFTDLQGAVFIDRKLYVERWNDPTANVARVYVKDGESPPAVRQRIQSALAGGKRLIILSNQEIRAYVLRLTDQWFAMTNVQVIVAVLVAVLGIVNTLTVSITDRRRELGVMQAVGGLRRQIRRTIWLEAVSIGAIGLLLGIALGAANVYYTLGMVRRDLGGLDLDYVFPLQMALTLIPVILGAAFAAAVGPAESAVRGNLVEALEYE
jgi:putative ABC transport system permease protein